MPRNEEYDWIFDFVLQFLESDKFDAAVMDFVDEKCFVFDEVEENKLIYTEIHHEFCDHVEALLASNLTEVGITSDQFLESCEKARSGRDINATVFERLVAMDDFQTFKKIMTKRNTELQLEAMKSFQALAVNTPHPSKSSAKSPKRFNTEEGKADHLSDGGDALMDPDELLALKEAEIMEFQQYENMHEEEMQELLFQSLMEMELIHRQEELEHAELERALMLSLIAEEERLNAFMIEAKTSSSDEQSSADRKDSSEPADSKSTEKSSSKESAESARDAKRTPKKLPPSSTSTSSLPDNFADIKPLKLKTDLKPLPSIKSLPSQTTDLVQDLFEKKKITEQTIKKGYEQLQGQRKNEEDLKQKLDPAEIERREKHMKEQRDLLIAKKKAEREKKVQAEEERQRKISAGESFDTDEKGGSSPKKFSSLTNDSKAGTGSYPTNDDIAEMRRATMRMALARRLKLDLIESEEAKRNEIQESQFAELDKKLQQVEQLREDNRKREYILNKQVERQQEQIARNIELSAALMSRQKDD